MTRSLGRFALSSFGLFAAALLVLVLNKTSRLYVSDLGSWDARHYYGMAETVGLTPAEAPFAYRWLPHELVALVPLPAKLVYELFTWLFLLGGAMVWRRVLESVGLDRARAVAVVVLGLLWARWGGVFYVWYRAGTDPLAYLLLGAGFLATERRNLAALAVVGVIGAMCREHVLLLFPYYFFRHAPSGNLARTAGAALATAVPAIATYAWVHAVTPTTGSYSLVEASKHWLAMKLGTANGLLDVAASLLTHSGFLFPLLLILPEGRRALMRPHLLFWIAACAVIGIVAGSDTDRLMYYAFGAEMIALALALEAIPSPENARQWIFWGTVVLAHLVLSQTFSDTVYAANVMSAWNLRVLAGWTLLVVIARRWAERAPAQAAGVSEPASVHAAR